MIAETVRAVFTADVTGFTSGVAKVRAGLKAVSSEQGSYTRTVDSSTASQSAFQSEVDSTAFKMFKLAAATGKAGDETGDLTRDNVAATASYDALQSAISMTNRELMQYLVTNKLARSGGLGGGPPGKGVATDVGSFFRQVQNAATGIIGFLGLIAPTVNLIIAGLVGVVALLGAAAIGAAALGAALVGVGAVMVLAAYKWRELMSSGTQGAEDMRQAFLAIEAQAFKSLNNIMAGFGTGSGSLWDSIAQGGVMLIQKMEPVFTKITKWVNDFVQSLSGPAEASGFLTFMKTWGEEWKKLGTIVNKDIMPGGPSIFTKYEAPAKAFVEGIAQVINALRKLSAMGLGLNMDQLAETIRNVFTAVSHLLPLWSRLSSALTPVALALSRFLLAMLPIIDAATDIAEAVMKNILGPLTVLVMFLTQHVLNLPIVSFFTSAAGAAVLLSFAISKLSFGLLSFKFLIGGGIIKSLMNFNTVLKYTGSLSQTLATYFPNLASGLGSVVRGLQNIGQLIPGVSKLGGLGQGLIGGGLVAAGVAASWVVINKAMGEADKMNQKVEASWDRLISSYARGYATLKQTKDAMFAAAVKEHEEAGIWGQIGYAWQHPGDVFGGDITDILSGATVDKSIQKEIDQKVQSNALAVTQNISSEVSSTKALTEEQIRQLNVLKNGEGTRQNYNAFLITAARYRKEDILTEGQYGKILDDLGVKYDANGKKVNTYALAVKGAGNTIANSLIAIRENADLGSKALEEFASGSGQDLAGLSQKMSEAILDPTQGILSGGGKITEFLQEQSDAIETWKNETSDAFNFVSQSFANLSSDGVLSSQQFINQLDAQADAAREYKRNLDTLINAGASDQLVSDVKDAGIGFAPQLAELVKGDVDATVQQLNRIERAGSHIGDSIADSLGKKLGVTLNKVTTAMELMTAALTGVKFKDIVARVDALTGSVKDNAHAAKDAEDAYVSWAKRGWGKGIDKKDIDPATQAMEQFREKMVNATGSTQLAKNEMEDYHGKLEQTKTDINEMPALHIDADTEQARTAVSTFLESLRNTTATINLDATVGTVNVDTHHTGLPVSADEHLAVLQKGEAVIQRKAVSKYGTKMMSDLNSMQLNVPRYHTGNPNVAQTGGNFQTTSFPQTNAVPLTVDLSSWGDALKEAINIAWTKGMPWSQGPVAAAWGGFSNGNIPLSAMTPIDSYPHYLAPDAANAFFAMQSAYGSLIRPITSAYRSIGTQADLYANRGSGPVAPPGTSMHGWGKALDLGAANAVGWMLNGNAARFNWHSGASFNDPYHFSYGITADAGRMFPNGGLANLKPGEMSLPLDAPTTKLALARAMHEAIGKVKPIKLGRGAPPRIELRVKVSMDRRQANRDLDWDASTMGLDRDF